MLHDKDTTEAFETEPQNVAFVCHTLFIHRFYLAIYHSAK